MEKKQASQHSDISFSSVVVARLATAGDSTNSWSMAHVTKLSSSCEMVTRIRESS